jgi:hypothetical protein
MKSSSMDCSFNDDVLAVFPGGSSDYTWLDAK